MTTNFAVGLHVFNTPRINRAHMLRLLAALAGALLLAFQIAPAAAAPASTTRLDPVELSYRLGKEEHAYDLAIGGAQYASQPDMTGAMPPMDVFAAPAAGSLLAPADGVAAPGGLDIERSAISQTLRDAIEKLGNTDEAAADDGAPAGDAPAGQPEGQGEQPAGEDDAQLDASDSGDELTLVVRDDFTNGGETALWTGETNGNEAFVSEEDGGWYIALVQPNVTFPLIATGQTSIVDGLIVTEAAFAGEGVGEVGLIGRSTLETNSYYYCAADYYGGAGCYLLQDGRWTSLFALEPGQVTRYQVDRLVLDIYGDTLTFIVNDTVVGSISGAGVAGGSWGLATSCYEGQCAGTFDYVEVYQYNTSAPDTVDTAAIIDADFVGEPADNWFTGEGEWGFADLMDDWYVVSMEPGWYFPNAIAGAELVNEGTITINAAFDGSGALGVIARMTTNEAGASSYYVCWVNSDAYANCHVVVDDVWYDIAGSTGATVTLQDVNVLSMVVIGDQIAFAVNSQMVTDAKDSTLAAGSMGLYHEAFDSGEYFDSYIDSVVVETFTSDAGSDSGNGSGAVLGSEMNENDLGLYVDQGEWGATSFFDGYYVTDLAGGWTFPNTIGGTASIQNGAMTEVVAFGGEGTVGLVARGQYSDAGMSYYACWLTSDAYAGCSLVVNGEWFTLAATEGQLQIGDFNELSMAVSGSQIGFAVNGQLIIEVVDETLASGDWGFFTEAYAYGDGQSFVSYVDYVTIEAFTS